jgi:FkbM family methyltransferase
MRKLIKRVVNGALMPLGLEVCRVGDDPLFAQTTLIKEDAATIFDVGAAGGEMIERYRSLFPRATIHAFEPFPESFRTLVSRFGTDKLVKLNEVAVTDAEGQITMNANLLPATNSLLNTDPRGDGLWGDRLLETQTTVQVPTITLDNYCRSNGIDSIDILKLDVQGSELKVLHGARSMLEGGRVKVIYMEIILAPSYIGQPNFEDYLGFFRGLGYTMLNMYNFFRRGTRLIQIDAIFTRDPEGPAA